MAPSCVPSRSAGEPGRPAAGRVGSIRTRHDLAPDLPRTYEEAIAIVAEFADLVVTGAVTSGRWDAVRGSGGGRRPGRGISAAPREQLSPGTSLCRFPPAGCRGIKSGANSGLTVPPVHPKGVRTATVVAGRRRRRGPASHNEQVRGSIPRGDCLLRNRRPFYARYEGRRLRPPTKSQLERVFCFAA